MRVFVTGASGFIGSAVSGALARAGIVHEVYLLPANDHGFDVNWGGFGTQIARARIEAFLRNTNGQTEGPST